MCCLPARQLTNGHEPACMCHCIVFGINPRVNVYLPNHTMLSLIVRQHERMQGTECHLQWLWHQRSSQEMLQEVR